MNRDHMAMQISGDFAMFKKYMDGNVYYKKNWVTPGTSILMWNKISY